MKHISLFEYYSEMPKNFSVQEIKNMTEDQFFMLFKELVDSEDEEQIFSLSQIWFNANPDAKYDIGFLNRLGKAAGKYSNVLGIDKKMQADRLQAQLSRPELTEEIYSLERSIKNYEDMIRMSKERLSELRLKLSKI